MLSYVIITILTILLVIHILKIRKIKHETLRNALGLAFNEIQELLMNDEFNAAVDILQSLIPSALNVKIDEIQEIIKGLDDKLKGK